MILGVLCYCNHTFLGDGISSNLNGGVRSGKNLVNTHTSYDSIANVDLKRQHNGAMLKDKYIESTKLSEDAMRNQNKGLTENIETALTSRSNVPHFSTAKLITIGNLYSSVFIKKIISSVIHYFDFTKYMMKYKKYF